MNEQTRAEQLLDALYRGEAVALSAEDSRILWQAFAKRCEAIQKVGIDRMMTLASEATEAEAEAQQSLAAIEKSAAALKLQLKDVVNGARASRALSQEDVK